MGIRRRVRAPSSLERLPPVSGVWKLTFCEDCFRCRTLGLRKVGIERCNRSGSIFDIVLSFMSLFCFKFLKSVAQGNTQIFESDFYLSRSGT